MAFMLLAFAVQVRGQELTVAGVGYRPFGLEDLDGELPPMIEVRYGFPGSPRSVFEIFVAAGSQRRGVARRVRRFAFYGGQVRRRLRGLDSPGGEAFLSLGAAGFISRYESYAPIFGHVGMGVRRRVSPRFAIRPELQLVTIHVVPIGMRFQIGGSVDLSR